MDYATFRGRLADSPLVNEDPKVQRLCGPFLIAATPEFLAATPRVMIVGQETNGSELTLGNFLSSPAGIDDAIGWYRDFNFAIGLRYASSPFWRFHRRVANQLSQPPRAVLWSNLIRFDGKYVTQRPSIIGESFCKPLMELQNGLLAHEIGSLKVDAVIFVTGPDYDDVIRDELPGCELTPLNAEYEPRQLARIRCDQFPTVKMVRTYHPNHWHWRARLTAMADEIAGFIGST